MSTFVNTYGCRVKISGASPIPVVSRGLETIADTVCRFVQDEASTNVLHHITNDNSEKLFNDNLQNNTAGYMTALTVEKYAILFLVAASIITLLVFMFLLPYISSGFLA